MLLMLALRERVGKVEVEEYEQRAEGRKKNPSRCRQDRLDCVWLAAGAASANEPKGASPGGGEAGLGHRSAWRKVLTPVDGGRLVHAANTTQSADTRAELGSTGV